MSKHDRYSEVNIMQPIDSDSIDSVMVTAIRWKVCVCSPIYWPRVCKDKAISTPLNKSNRKWKVALSCQDALKTTTLYHCFLGVLFMIQKKILHYPILYNSIVWDSILYYTILYYTIRYYTILYYSILCYTMLYYTILIYTILYYTILWHSIILYL